MKIQGYLLLGMLLYPFYANSESCIVAGKPTQLTGLITVETFPGLPNYESIKKGDEPETYWILVTDKPHCGQGEDFSNPGEMINEKDQSRFQLVLTPEQYKNWGELVHKKVLVNGSMFTAHTGHHHTPLLIEVSRIIPTP